MIWFVFVEWYLIKSVCDGLNNNKIDKTWLVLLCFVDSDIQIQEDHISPTEKRPRRIIDLPMPPSLDEPEDDDNDSEEATPGGDSKGNGPKIRLPK